MPKPNFRCAIASAESIVEGRCERNFRKKILSMELLDKQDEKERETSKKGAWYYRFNLEKYKELARNGFFFNLTVS